MTTLKLTGGVLGLEVLKIRCNLAEAASPVEVDYGTGDGWEGTQYQCADTLHLDSGLARLGQLLAERATETHGDECDWEEVNA